MVQVVEPGTIACSCPVTEEPEDTMTSVRVDTYRCPRKLLSGCGQRGYLIWVTCEDSLWVLSREHGGRGTRAQKQATKEAVGVAWARDDSEGSTLQVVGMQ